jgi:tetrapyrrole methylase family protein/MazG family protein
VTPTVAARPLVHVVGLGPAGPEFVTAGTLELLGRVPHRLLRTTRHPAAVVLAGSPSCDHHYESAERIEDVYASIVSDVVAQARAHGELAYAVPGSPMVAERTVELLAVDDRVTVRIHPAMSFLDLAWARLGVDPVEVGVRLVDGHRFAAEAAGQPGPLLVAQCDSRFVLSDVKLAVEEPPCEPVVVLQRLGLADESVRSVAWEDLDRLVEADHLTSLWIPRLAEPVAAEVVRFDELMRRLRVEDPWKADQTHDSLKRFLLEEAYEVFEAIDAYDSDTGAGAEELCAELGDLLYQVVFHSAIGAEAGWFTLADVARSIHDKLVGRHGHLVATTGGRPAEAGVAGAVADWERAKRTEQSRASAFDGIPAALPALARALKLARKAEALGLEPPPHPPLTELVERLSRRPDDPDTVADLLVAAADAARVAGLDPEDTLRRRLSRDEAALRAAEAASARSPQPPT